MVLVSTGKHVKYKKRTSASRAPVSVTSLSLLSTLHQRPAVGSRGKSEEDGRRKEGVRRWNVGVRSSEINKEIN
jgi:hypothetical protein